MSDLPHAYGFDPTYGYTLDRLLAIQPPDEPTDLAAFWEQTYADTMTTSLRIETTAVQSPLPEFIVQLVTFDGLYDVRLGGWLVAPADEIVDRYVVTGHGYYNRPIEDIQYLPRTANFFFSCRGLGLSRVAGISDQTMSHVLHGIDSKETYVHRGCVADTWSAASVVLDMFENAAGRLEYAGESFGGGIGAMALAWDSRFGFADLRVPSFGHHPLRLNCRCTGSGEAVRRKLRRSPGIYDATLQYFDAAVHARRILIPTAFACALFDPAVPPPGQFAVYNSAICTKVLTVWRTGHHDWVGTAEGICDADAAAAALRDKIFSTLE